MTDHLRIALEALAVPVLGTLLGGLALAVGVVGTAIWAGWSRNRDCERRGWRNLSRW